MDVSYLEKSRNEPYRFYFPLGTFLLLCGIFVWVPLIWNPGEYPVILHRTLVLNGFAGSFIGGFLMTAVPKFSQTQSATRIEFWTFFLVTLMAMIFAHFDWEQFVFISSALQPLLLLKYLFVRITKRKANPPYSFIFIFVGLILWVISALFSAFVDSDGLKHLHYEGAIACIILGVGSRLIPGILGHVEIVQTQRNAFEKNAPIIKTVPPFFFAIILSFAGSYFLSNEIGTWIRATVVLIIGMGYWKLWQLPKDKSSLTACIWFSSWMIVLSFFIRAFWREGEIHITHSFFINGIVLLSLLIGTRVLQSHGPKDKKLENLKILYVITGFVFLSGITRVTAFLLPPQYLTHLAYSAIVLALGVILWAIRYLPFIRIM